VVSGSGAIGPDDLPDDVEGRAVLLSTGWSQHWGTDRYLDQDHPYLTPAGAAALVDRRAVLVGIDSLNIDSTQGGDRSAHSALLAAGIAIVEHLTNLDQLPPTGSRFTAVPVKVAGMGTFPVRAFATITPRSAVCEVVVDCHDVSAQAAFWSAVLSAPAWVRSVDWATVHEPDGLLLAFQKVPESKSVKNRVHLDVWTQDIAADTARLVALGAVAVGEVVSDPIGAFQVLLDPEGNEFCLVL
jgi:predicted enzyme related to lactoylglutathione lyase